MKKIHLLTLFLLLFAAAALRWHKITNPVADWHSWRQSDTAAVARNFEKFGFDPIRPRYDDLSSIPSGKDNPMGWRMVEFPLYQSVAYLGRSIFQSLPVEMWLRIVTIASSLGTALLIWLLMRRHDSILSAFFALLSFALLPYGIYFGRTILPEPFAVFWAVLSVYLLTRGLFLPSALAAAAALLVKPTALFLLLPVPYLLGRRFRLLFFLFIVFLPFAIWRLWISQFPEGIPAFGWLLNAGDIRFKGAWFYWLFAERVGKLLLGYWGLIPFALGILLPAAKKEGWVFRLWLLGSLLYFVVVARGNVQHDYYQILLLPVISVYLGKGFAFLWKNSSFSLLASRFSLLAFFAFMLAFSWYTIRTYYWVNRPEIVEAGRVADLLLPKDAKVIASYNGDTTFLYQTNRQGWPLGFDIPKKLQMGATHYVTVSPTDADYETMGLSREFTVLVRNDKFAIIDLTKPNAQ